MRLLGPQTAASTLKIYALIIIVTSALACVKPINAGVRVYVVRQAARGHADGRERRTGNRSMRGEPLQRGYVRGESSGPP